MTNFKSSAGGYDSSLLIENHKVEKMVKVYGKLRSKKWEIFDHLQTAKINPIRDTIYEYQEIEDIFGEEYMVLSGDFIQSNISKQITTNIYDNGTKYIKTNYN